MHPSKFLKEHDGTWSTGAQLDDAGELAKVILRRNKGAATIAHVQAAAEVVDQWPKFRRALQPALFAFYCRTAARATDVEPQIAAANEVWPHVTFDELEVFSDERGRPEFVHGYGRCAWEEEHGLEVVLRGNRELVYVGSYDGWTYGYTPPNSDWNFADAATQQAAVEEKRQCDAESSSTSRPSDAGVQSAQTETAPRPWWKFWRS